MSKEHLNYLRRKTADEAELWAADRIEELERELEREQMRLAACSTVAITNTPESAAKARKMLQEYRSASLQDVIRAVDSEMALRQERDTFYMDYRMKCDEETKSLCMERDALQADNARLREALKEVLDGETASDEDVLAIIHFARQTLDATPEQSLARLRNQVREECAGVCDRFAEREMHPAECAAAILATKEPE